MLSKFNCNQNIRVKMKFDFFVLGMSILKCFFQDNLEVCNINFWKINVDISLSESVNCVVSICACQGLSSVLLEFASYKTGRSWVYNHILVNF